MCRYIKPGAVFTKGLSQVLGLTFVQKYSQLKPETWLRPFVNTAQGNQSTFHLQSSVGIGARSFNIDRSSHGTADIDTYYQHFNIETTYKKQTKTK